GAGWVGLEGALRSAVLAYGSLGLGAANLIGSLIAPQPNIQQNASPAVSDSHYLQGTGNTARPWNPIPTVLGRVTFAPPLGGQQINETRGDDNWVRSTFCIGYGPVEVDASDIFVGGTRLSVLDANDFELEIREGFPGDAKKQLYEDSQSQQDVGGIVLTAKGEDHEPFFGGQSTTGFWYNATGYWGRDYIRFNRQEYAGSPVPFDSPLNTFYGTDFTTPDPDISKTGRLTTGASEGATSITIGLIDNTEPKVIEGPTTGNLTLSEDGNVWWRDHASILALPVWFTLLHDQPGALAVTCSANDVLMVQLDDNTWQEVVVSSAPVVATGFNRGLTPDKTEGDVPFNLITTPSTPRHATGRVMYDLPSLSKTINLAESLDGPASAGNMVFRAGSRWATRTGGTDGTGYSVTLFNNGGMRIQEGQDFNPIQQVIMVWHRTSDVGSGAGRWVAAGCAGDTDWTNVPGQNIQLNGSNIEQKPDLVCCAPSSRAIVWKGKTDSSGFATITISGLTQAVYDVRVGVASASGVDQLKFNDSGWNPHDNASTANIQWQGLGLQGLPVASTIKDMASVSVFLKATGEFTGTIDALTVNCEKLLPYYTKGGGYNNGTWTSPHPRTVKGRLNGTFSATDTTLSVTPFIVVKVYSGSLPLQAGDEWIYVGPPVPTGETN
ncbi:MAG: hypothetical protein NZ777_11480, partial [Pseudomonadales bacterium]|nr:hypothetical protein [Pseudomonadales bacterium]